MDTTTINRIKSRLSELQEIGTSYWTSDEEAEYRRLQRALCITVSF